MPTYTSLTNKEDHALYEERAKNIDLIWCKQAIDLCESFGLMDKFSINDIGCCYGQLYKEIKRRGLGDKVSYLGYDVDAFFLGMALRNFPEAEGKFVRLDIEKEAPSQKDVTVCSACLEHLDDPFVALNAMLLATSKLLILRTFVGPESVWFVQEDKRFATVPYNINAFNLYDLSDAFFCNGFDFHCYIDKATNSSVYEIGEGSGVVRQMYVVVGLRRL